MEHNPHEGYDADRLAATDEADRFFSPYAVIVPMPKRIGYTGIEVLPELKGKLWNNAALCFVHGLRPSAIRVTQGKCTADMMAWRVTVFVEADNRTIFRIEQEVDVGLIGARFAADLHSFMKGSAPLPMSENGIINVFNVRGLDKIREKLPPDSDS
jgi:hypothetical protein